ncbi:MAG: type II secretion system protein, partial [Limisphaerales bacterium]
MNTKILRARRHFVGAFTLVELLVVVAIIGILAALLLTALARGKAQGQSAACKNHVRQIGLALTMYASEAHRCSIKFSLPVLKGQGRLAEATADGLASHPHPKSSPNVRSAPECF